MISAALELGLGSYEGPEEAELTKHAGGRDKSHVKVTPDLWGTLCKTCTKDTVVTKNTGSGVPGLWFNLSSASSSHCELPKPQFPHLNTWDHNTMRVILEFTGSIK